MYKLISTVCMLRSGHAWRCVWPTIYKSSCQNSYQLWLRDAGEKPHSKPRYTLHQGVRERARVPQLVMLCRRWAHLQCFAGRTGRTHGTTAGCCILCWRKTPTSPQHQTLKKLKVSNTHALSLTPCLYAYSLHLCSLLVLRTKKRWFAHIRTLHIVSTYYIVINSSEIFLSRK